MATPANEQTSVQALPKSTQMQDLAVETWADIENDVASHSRPSNSTIATFPPTNGATRMVQKIVEEYPKVRIIFHMICLC
jgi:hypothetical protein